MDETREYRYQARRWRWLGMDVFHPGSNARIEEYRWENCRAEVIRKTISTGSSIRRDCRLELAIIDPSTGKVVQRFRVGDSNFSMRSFLWETIRRYMEHGAQAIPAPALTLHRETLADCVEEFNPFFLPAKSAPGAQRIMSYVFATLLWMILIPLPLVMFHAGSPSRCPDRCGSKNSNAADAPPGDGAVPWRCSCRWRGGFSL